MTLSREYSNEIKTDAQGIIASGYGHLPRVGYYFMHIDDVAGTQPFIEAVRGRIRTGEDWPRDATGDKIKPDHAWSIAFTFKGLETMGLPEDTLMSFSREFIEGMVTDDRARKLGDTGESDPANWQIGGAAHTGDDAIHILMILYAQDETCRQRERDWLGALVAAHGVRFVYEDEGRRPAADKEPFGFRDGVSNPKVQGFGSDTLEPSRVVVKTGEFLLGYPNEYDQYPETPIVWHDPDNMLHGFDAPGIPADVKDFGRNGTYLVYRKLKQDVIGFWRFMQAQATHENGHVDTQRMRLLASKFVGRWPGGTPLVQNGYNDDADADGDDLPKEVRQRINAFEFMPTDPHGFACPYSSHIRRANPRDSFLGDAPDASFKTSNQHRIMRRGTSWGPALITPDMTAGDNVPLGLPDDSDDMGIHFIAINANIRRQFEFVQLDWCNNRKFNGLYDDRDPIIGNNDATGHVTIEQNAVRERVHDVPRFVNVLGGEYFFLPSLTALRYLANLPT